MEEIQISLTREEYDAIMYLLRTEVSYCEKLLLYENKKEFVSGHDERMKFHKDLVKKFQLAK